MQNVAGFFSGIIKTTTPFLFLCALAALAYYVFFAVVEQIRKKPDREFTLRSHMANVASLLGLVVALSIGGTIDNTFPKKVVAGVSPLGSVSGPVEPVPVVVEKSVLKILSNKIEVVDLYNEARILFDEKTGDRSSKEVDAIKIMMVFKKDLPDEKVAYGILDGAIRMYLAGDKSGALKCIDFAMQNI
ncbi:hypothetical protein [Desulfovibrio sp. JC010]|uniref:hypothetical protein n=1 Tax=Desulfovibrio sp. JC010 TaxID=2593641 RepID=UPI0013CFF24C|nr:hypothetical protein [Desulfovibrio sp. JC010]